MRRNQLVYRKESGQQDGTSMRLIALHGYGADSAQLLALGHSVAPGCEILAPESPRPVTPNIYGRDDGKCWYIQDETGRPEPATFGDSLWQVEQFMLGILDADGGPPTTEATYLVGVDQGAVIGITLACLWPELLAGVVAVNGYLPRILGWSPEFQEMNGLPVLLIYDQNDETVPEDTIANSASDLEQHGAEVTVSQMPAARDLPSRLGSVIAAWLTEQAGHSTNRRSRPSGSPGCY